VHPVIPLEILREPLVDRVQVNDAEVTHKSIMAHHNGATGTGRIRPAATHAAQYLKQPFKGRMSRADIDRRCTTPGRLARETRWALKRELDHSDDQDVARSRDDIIVKAVMVQGGEADIGGEKTAFARIVMSGVGVQQVKVDDHAPRRQEVAVLKLDDAAAFADGLHEVVDRMVRSTPTPAVPAMGNWSWTSAPPLDEDLLVAQVSTDGAAVPAVTGMTSTVRVDFTGTLVQGLTVANPAVHVQGAIFSGPRQAQALVSSLRKVVRSALEQPRVENYVSAAASLSAFRI